jgi:hypothetical protein
MAAEGRGPTMFARIGVMMSDFARILGEGDDIVNNWRSDQTSTRNHS